MLQISSFFFNGVSFITYILSHKSGNIGKNCIKDEKDHQNIFSNKDQQQKISSLKYIIELFKFAIKIV